MGIDFNGSSLSKIIYNGTDLAKVVYNGVTVWEKTHVHTDACYRTYTPSTGWGNCGWCGHSANYSSSGSTCPSCGKSPCYPQSVREKICGYE